MPARLTVHVSPDALGDAVASSILDDIDRANDSHSRFLLGAPTGRTPRPILTALAKQLAARPRDLRHVTLVMMDEYLVPSGGKTHGEGEGADGRQRIPTGIAARARPLTR